MHTLFGVAFLAAAIASPVVAPAPPSALDRAEAALLGLTHHFSQTEPKQVNPAPRPKGCPCFSCGGRNCTAPTCGWCSVKEDAGCSTPESPGCYTTASDECICDLPPGQDPAGANSAATFYFSCGQIGGLGPMGGSTGINTCGCETEWSFGCTNCYRWWSAVALEASVNYCIAAGMAWNSTGPCAEVTKAAESTWAHAPYNDIWDASISAVYIDDFTWYSLAYIRVYEWTGNEVWRQRAAGLHDWAWKFGWDKRPGVGGYGQCGGFWWNLLPKFKFKTSISIVEMLHSAVKIASTFPEGSANRTRFTQSAVSIWNWLFEFDEGRGLIADNGIMSTGAVPIMCCNATSAAAFGNSTTNGSKCANSGAPGMSYSHGLLMSSAVLLHNVTGDKDYLITGLRLLDAAVENLTNSEGAVKDAQRGSRQLYSSSCECGSDPGSDFFSFKGIFAAHLAYFTDTLNRSGILSLDAYNKSLSLIKRSSDNAWTRSASWPPFTKSGDICGGYLSKKHTSSKANYPKFHWWWSNSTGTIETPPDASWWFAMSSIFCSYKESNATNTSSPIRWSGQVDSADVCQARCVADSQCIKYMFRVYSDTPDYCPCKTCQGKVCWQPQCDYCGTLADNSCPTKNSTGCYTTTAAACTCTKPKPTKKPHTNANCWLYGPDTGGNRTHGNACTQRNSDYTFAAKRPPLPTPLDPATTCRGRCENDSAIYDEILRAQGVNVSSWPCRCDAACTRHFDCCQDYVEHCLPSEGQHPSCSGRCKPTELTNPQAVPVQALGLPIRGGGYCYCDSSCEDSIFTDNNSYGGCCADYASQCESASADPVCFDARTQGSALHLFVAHHVIETIGK